MSLDLVYVVHCNRCDAEDSEAMDTAELAERLALATGWTKGPDDGDHLCPSCTLAVSEGF